MTITALSTGEDARRVAVSTLIAPPRDDGRQSFRVYARDPDSGLLVSDGLTYRGEHVAWREARKITRVLGQPAEARPA
jgi:hypothetical protein